MDILPIRYFNGPEPMKEIKHFFRTGAVVQHFYLEQPGQQDGKVADQEMPGNGLFFLQIYRPRVKLRFHDPERFLYPPQIMVSGINL